MNFKKIVFASLIAMQAFSLKATDPDEGMWLPMLINKNYDDMKKSDSN
jgi:hypothetical protein